MVGALAWVLGGIVIGVVSAFAGLGGGFLAVPLLLGLGFESERAVGTSFVLILLVAVSALAAYGRVRAIDWRVGLLLAAGGLLGAQIGVHLQERIGTPAFTKIFAVLLAAVALRMFFQR